MQDTRYKMLQAQINPHFLYNTLSTLSWLVRAGKTEDANRLIISLGNMLRAAPSPKQNTTAAADVQLVRNYIDIQQLRYKRRAAFAPETDGTTVKIVLKRQNAKEGTPDGEAADR